MTCFMSKGDMEDRLTNFILDLRSSIILVKGVPSHVCKQCGEVFYSDDVKERLEKIVQELKNSPAEVAISQYVAA